MSTGLAGNHIVTYLMVGLELTILSVYQQHKVHKENIKDQKGYGMLWKLNSSGSIV
jgi:hypothetical protein